MHPSRANANGAASIAESKPRGKRQSRHEDTKKLVLSIRKKQNALSTAYHAIVLPPVILHTISHLETSIKNGAFETLLQLLHDQIEIKPFINTERTESLQPVQQIPFKHHRNSIEAVDKLRRRASSYCRTKEENRIQFLIDIKQDFVELLNNHFPQEEVISVGMRPDECNQRVQQLLENGIQTLEEWCTRSDIADLDKLIQELNSMEDSLTIALPKTPLQNAKTHQSLNIMLKSIDRFQPFLRVILEKNKAFNERIQSDLNTPLHYAVRSQNASFIEWLLGQQSLDVNCRNKQMKTALFVLCEQYKAAKKICYTEIMQLTHLKDCRKYILLLLQHGADFNICSSKALLPYEIITQKDKHKTPDSEKMKLEEQEFFMQCENEMQQRSGPILTRRDEKFTNVEYCNNKIIELYETFLRFKDLETFDEEFGKYCVNKNEISKVITLLLHTAVELNLEKCVDLIVSRYEKEIFAAVPVTSHLKYRVELKRLLKKACESGNSAILAKLLSKMEKDNHLINGENILVYTLHLCAKSPNASNHKSNLLKCAELLANDKRIFHTLTDKYGNTALQLALKHGLTDIAKALTVGHRNLFLGVENKKGETPLDYASYEFCKEYFDQCVSHINSGDILIDLNGINPYIWKKSYDVYKANPKVRHNKGTESKHFLSEMACLNTMANSKMHKPLLQHPVIYTFILIKWLRFSLWHFINLLLTMLAAVAFSFFSVEYICHENFSIPWYIASWCGLIYVFVRELLQWITFGNKYFHEGKNWVDMVLIFGMLIYLVLKDYTLISSLVVIIFAYQIIQLIGSLPFNSISTYWCMFRVVALSFIKSFALFCPLIVAFAYSFYLYYNDKLVPVNRNGTDNPFDSIPAAVVKIVVMGSGEFEAAAMQISGSLVFIFLMFIFCVPMVMQNLINGLAVSDISEIRKESESINLSEKVRLLARFESGLNRNIDYKPLRHILKYLRRLFPGQFFKNYQHVIKISMKKDDAIIMVDARYSQLRYRGMQGHYVKLPCLTQTTDIEKGEEIVLNGVQPQTDPELEQRLLPSKEVNGAPAPKSAERKKTKNSKHSYEPLSRGIFLPLATLDGTVLEELLSIAKQKEIRNAQK